MAFEIFWWLEVYQDSNMFQKRRVQFMSQGWTICLAYMWLCKPCLKFASVLYQRATLAIWISRNKNQILILFWFFEKLRWKSSLFLKVLRMLTQLSTSAEWTSILFKKSGICKDVKNFKNPPPTNLLCGCHKCLFPFCFCNVWSITFLNANDFSSFMKI